MGTDRYLRKLVKRFRWLSGGKDPPHHQLVKTTDDAALLNFMRKWGPLYYCRGNRVTVDL